MQQDQCHKGCARKWQIQNALFDVEPHANTRGDNQSGTHQRDTVQQVWSEAQKAYEADGRQVVTEIQTLSNYSRAEDYHQHYFALHPGQGYCAHVIAPKLDKFRKTCKNSLKH